MKRLTFIFLWPLLLTACSKNDDSIFKPESLQEEQKKVDTVYSGLDAMATDNGYDSISDLLENESWRPLFEQKFLIRIPADTFYLGSFQPNGSWSFQFAPWPFNTNRIIRLNGQGSQVKEEFEPFPNRFEVDGKANYLLTSHIRYVDSTLSFDLKRETLLDSIITIEYIRLQTEL